MMIIAVTIIQDERHLIEATIRHLLAHGINRIMVIDHRSTDGTTEILERLALETGRIEVERKEDQIFHQPQWANELAEKAAAYGATWIFPFDADEIFVPLTQPTLAEELAAAGQGVLLAQIWHHADLDHRKSAPTAWHKSVFSWVPGCTVNTGAHDVANHPGPVLGGRIEIRERYHLNAEHFMEKTRRHLASGTPCSTYLNRSELSDAQLRAEYEEWACEASAVHDPIPLRK